MTHSRCAGLRTRCIESAYDDQGRENGCGRSSYIRSVAACRSVRFAASRRVGGEVAESVRAMAAVAGEAWLRTSMHRILSPATVARVGQLRRPASPSRAADARRRLAPAAPSVHARRCSRLRRWASVGQLAGRASLPLHVGRRSASAGARRPRPLRPGDDISPRSRSRKGTPKKWGHSPIFLTVNGKSVNVPIFSKRGRPGAANLPVRRAARPAVTYADYPRQCDQLTTGQSSS